MKTIAICNHKGGVGKTALSMAIAEGLHRKGKRTLLVDLDQQMNATQQAKIDTTDEVTVYDLLTSFDYTAKDGIKHFDGGDIIPGDVLEATLTPTEKKIFRALCDEAGCTEAELIRSVLIHREISLEDLGDDMQVSDRKKKALHRQQYDFRRAQNAREVDECGEPLTEKRNSYLRVMLTAPEKRAIEQRAAALGISVSELVRRSAIYGKIESFNFDIAEVEKLHHELLKETKQ